jgi:hypothetical protein
MRIIAVAGIACLLLAFDAITTSGSAFGGMGGATDPWASPYSLYVTPPKPPTWPDNGPATGSDGKPIDCHGDKACEQKAKKSEQKQQ